MRKRAGQSWMWAEACDMVDEAERLHRRFFELLAAPATTPTWEPPANVFSSDGEIFIAVALPGADLENVVVRFTAEGLQIEARVPPPRLGPRASILRLEVPYGTMRRQISLPAGPYTLIERRLSNGCLHLRLTESGA